MLKKQNDKKNNGETSQPSLSTPVTSMGLDMSALLTYVTSHTHGPSTESTPMADEYTAMNQELQTSLMRAQEETARLRRALEKIERAIIEEGKMPAYHKKVMERHRLEWGTLHNAIDDAIEVLHGKVITR